MTIVSVGAAGNGSGKTLTIASILREFPDTFTAVKFTTVARDGVNCPRTEKACACRSLRGRFTVVEDDAVINAPDTDTGRIARAGARSVLWCLCSAGAHREAWDHLRDRHLAGARHVITEGNTVIPILQPSLLVMVMSPKVPRARWKADTLSLARRADLLIVNRHDAPPDDVAHLRAGMASLRGDTPPVEDVSLPLSAWIDPRLRELVAAILDPRPPAG